MFDKIVNTPLRRTLALTIFFAAAAAILWSAKGSSLYVDIELLSVGEAAPNFNLRRMDNQEQSLDVMRGSVVWMIFGRTDNSGTVAQLKEAKEISDKYRDKDIRILFLVQSQPFAEVKKFVEEKGCPAAVLFDVGGRVAKKYHARRWPTSYILDKTGRIQGVQRGLWTAGNSSLNRLMDMYIRSGTRYPDAPATPAPTEPPIAATSPDAPVPEGGTP